MVAILMWKSHITRATVLRSNDVRQSEPLKIAIPEGNIEAEMWFFELYDSVTKEDFSRMCELAKAWRKLCDT